MYYPSKLPIPTGKKRFIVTYEGLGIQFKTDIDAKNTTEAKEYFKKFYPSAKFISIKKK